MQYLVYLLLLELLLRILYLIYLNIKNNRHFLTYFTIKKLLAGNISANEDFVDTNANGKWDKEESGYCDFKNGRGAIDCEGCGRCHLLRPEGQIRFWYWPTWFQGE